MLAPEVTFDEYLATPLEAEEVEVQPIDLSMASMQGSGSKGSSSELGSEVRTLRACAQTEIAQMMAQALPMASAADKAAARANSAPGAGTSSPQSQSCWHMLSLD